MADAFQWLKGHVLRLIGPAPSAAAVTPSDATVFAQPSRGLYIGTAGNVAVRMLESQNTIAFSNVPAGTMLPVRVDMVMLAGTSAGNIISVY
jgi:hypothetical protein